MFEDVTRPIVRTINSTYQFFYDSLKQYDTPGTYILWIVIGLIYVPFFVKSVYNQYANPHAYHTMPLLRKAVMGTIFIIAWLVLGYANFIRFIPVS